MRQIPFFAPYRDEHIAAVLTVPDEPPRGLVVTLTPNGEYQVIGSKFCARTAAAVVEDGLAAVRFDYAGMGDSTGLVDRWGITDVDEVVEQARAVLGVARQVTGVSHFAAVGTCYGSHVALRLLDDPACTGAVCLAAPVLEFGGRWTLRNGFRDKPILSLVRRQPLLRRLILRPARSLLKERTPSENVIGALAHLDCARLLFLYSEHFSRDHYDPAAADRLTAAVSALDEERRSRFDLRILQTGPMVAFDLLPHEDVQTMVAEVTSWLRGCFDPASSAREVEPARAT